MKAYIVLENGDIFAGVLNNTSSKQVYGDVVFYTSMTAYEEIITDPTVHNHIIVFTSPLIGNCGINKKRVESNHIQASGLIVNELSEEGYHYESNLSLGDYCNDQNVPILSNVDTRAIVKRIRAEGEMKAVITTDLESVSFPLEKEKSDPVRYVATEAINTYEDKGPHVVIVDYGYRNSLLSFLQKTHCKVTVVPYTTSEKKIKEMKPDGIIVSSGPGNPNRPAAELQMIKSLAMSYPTFGIGLGHQLIAKAFGATIEKLHVGHRSMTEPVIDVQTNKVYMTSQFHKYVVKADSLKNTPLQRKFMNVNDESIEGLIHPGGEIITTQFHPGPYPGPADSDHVFYSFIDGLYKKGREKVYA